jgi:hypothetical protein
VDKTTSAVTCKSKIKYLVLKCNSLILFSRAFTISHEFSVWLHLIRHVTCPRNEMVGFTRFMNIITLGYFLICTTSSWIIALNIQVLTSCHDTDMNIWTVWITCSWMSYSLLFCHCVGNIGEFSYSRNKLWIANSGYKHKIYMKIWIWKAENTKTWKIKIEIKKNRYI